jgi:uncharacterized membrane protein YadS
MELVPSVPTVGAWTSTVVEGLSGRLPGLIVLGASLAVLTGLAVRTMGDSFRAQCAAFGPLFLLAVASYVLAEQRGVKASGFEYVFWALVIGLLISNTIGTPAWLRPAVRGEFYIKTGLVLLGAEILFGRILTLGAPGLFVSWLVVPLVVIFMYLFGTRVLGMANKSLVIVIAAATSVCGVSAAIAAAAAARAKKEELTLTVCISLMFTVAMMIVMPFGIRVAGMDEAVGAAWIGGTIDSTGAVVAAGAMLGELGEEIAAVVKLIGVIAFAIAVFWVTKVEPRAGVRPDVSEIWHRFPKFILGFVGASLVFSFVLTPMVGEEAVAGIIDRTADLRGWFFCVAFVSIGLDSNMRELGGQLAGGKPVQLYVVGQLFNLVLTLIAAYLAFGGILFEKIV